MTLSNSEINAETRRLKAEALEKEQAAKKPSVPKNPQVAKP